jgi:hypothetical protein
MRHWSIVGSVGPLTGRAGNGRSHVRASRAVPRARTSWADNESSWAVLPENVPEDPVDEPDVLY